MSELCINCLLTQGPYNLHKSASQAQPRKVHLPCQVSFLYLIMLFNTQLSKPIISLEHHGNTSINWNLNNHCWNTTVIDGLSFSFQFEMDWREFGRIWWWSKRAAVVNCQTYWSQMWNKVLKAVSNWIIWQALDRKDVSKNSPSPVNISRDIEWRQLTVKLNQIWPERMWHAVVTLKWPKCSSVVDE